MNDTQLLLIADPLCGWCFGASPLLTVARQIPDLKIRLYSGGLFSGPNSRPLDSAMRQFILGHHERIAQLSGQDVGEGFIALLDSGQGMLDSTPPIRGILATGKCGGDPLEYYQALIQAHFIDGRLVAEQQTLLELALACNLEESAFQEAFAALGASSVSEHIMQTRRLMQSVGAQGFPTFVIEHEGQRQIVSHHPYCHDPSAWKQLLIDRIGSFQEQSVL